MTTLILAQFNKQNISADTMACLGAALQLKQPVDMLIAHRDAKAAAEILSTCQGVQRVLCSSDNCYAHGHAENISQLLISLANEYDYILAPANTFGKNILPRVAAALDVAQISDVVKIEGEDAFTRPIYAGNALLTLQSNDPIKVMTIRPSAFSTDAGCQAPCDIIQLEAVCDDERIVFIEEQSSSTDLPSLNCAKVIVSGGRGLTSSEQFHSLLTPLAKKMGAAIGASRAAVDAGYMSNEYQIGQTGKVVAPDLYFAIGISGAIQHLAGMQGSKVIVAINNDPQAKIFEVADYGVVADLNTAIPLLMELLTE